MGLDQPAGSVYWFNQFKDIYSRMSRKNFYGRKNNATLYSDSQRNQNSMANAKRHEMVVKTLIRKIFTKNLGPGDKLPAERELAREMDLDRTSLRMALRQLESMQILDIRHGDGVYVKDYLKFAGIDFLRTVFMQSDSVGGRSGDDGDSLENYILDEYVLDEIWEFWANYFPVVLRLASQNTPVGRTQALIDIMDEELACLDDRKRIVELELRSQDVVAENTKNIVFILISNSSRPLRKKMIEMFVGCLSREELTDHINLKKDLLKRYMSGSLNAVHSGQEYAEVLEGYRRLMLSEWKPPKRPDREQAGGCLETGRRRRA